MDKSVQDFLQVASPGTYFETTFGRFIFVERVGGLGYTILFKGVGGLWKPIAVFHIMGKFQDGKQRRVSPNDFYSEV